MDGVVLKYMLVEKYYIETCIPHFKIYRSVNNIFLLLFVYLRLQPKRLFRTNNMKLH